MDELTCVVCGKPATQKYLTISSDMDPIYADVCDECAAKHTWRCIDSHLLNIEYERDWPNYCRKCGGWSGHLVGGTYWEPPDFNVCPDCICEGKCPRCGHQHDEDWDGDVCEACDWNPNWPGLLDIECSCGEQDWDMFVVDDEPFSYNDLPDHDY